MGTPTHEDIEALASRVRRDKFGKANKQTETELQSDLERAQYLLGALLSDRSEVVRLWAANVARRVLGRDAVPPNEDAR
jgi:hypothetical protein